jgi:hypothetical protein
MTSARTSLPWSAPLLIALLIGGPAGADTVSITASPANVIAGIDKSHGYLAELQADGAQLASDCLDEYWLEGEGGEVTARSSEGQDEVLALDVDGEEHITLHCRNADLGVDFAKTYAPGPVLGTIRKTVAVKPFARPGILHVMSRVRLGEPLAQASLYTPRQSWGGKTLLFGVRKLADISEPITSTSGWDNRFVVAFTGGDQPALAQWRSEVDGTYVPATGIIAPWGAESPYGLTYLPDGWRFRLLMCPEGTAASASADYVALQGDWYEAWAAYKRLPGFREAYRCLDTSPEWCRKIKYGSFWNAPNYEGSADAASKLCERLGDGYLSIGVFGWSLDGDYETDRPFMVETLSMVLTPDYMRRAVDALQTHPRAKVGLYIQGGLIDSQSQCFRDHPEWVIHGADGRPQDSGFADNPVGRMYMGDARAEEWVTHHLSRVRAVLERYGCRYIYLDGGGFSERMDWHRRHVISFADEGRLNERFLNTVRAVGADRGLLCNFQNAPYADMSWLECGYFGPQVPWRDTVDFCFDTECLQDPRYPLEPLYWRDNDRYLAVCVAFGFTPCGDLSPEKPDATWRAIEAAYEMKLGRLILDSDATSPVWWRDGVPVVTFAEKVGDGVVVPVLNFGADESVHLTVSLANVGLDPQARLDVSLYRPLMAPETETRRVTPTGGRLQLDLKAPTSWRGLTLVRLR